MDKYSNYRQSQPSQVYGNSLAKDYLTIEEPLKPSQLVEVEQPLNPPKLVEQLDSYQTFIALSRYARWIEDLNRRETWKETVARHFDFFTEHLAENTNYKLDPQTRDYLEASVYNLETMPSMRCLMTAGKALKQNNIAGFNCAYLAVDNIRVFDEILYILMHGTGIGFSVERQFINKLPRLPAIIMDDDSSDTFVIGDSKEGWQQAYRHLIESLYKGLIPEFDFSKIRKKGSRLKIFGGRASGKRPLMKLFDFTVDIFKDIVGYKWFNPETNQYQIIQGISDIDCYDGCERKLTSYDVHRIICKIAEIVVSGGVEAKILVA